MSPEAKLPFRWLLLGMVILAVGVGWRLFFPGTNTHSNQATLPIHGQISDFTLTEKSGKSLTAQALAQQVWVADFIFTSCKAECPLMNLEMAKIQQAFLKQDAVKLVSFTVDPETDTPQRLKTYAQNFKAVSDKWYFLTGERPTLMQLTQQDFKLTVTAAPSHEHHQHGASPASDTVSQPFLHSQKFVLVDQQRRIRGYYDSQVEADITRLIQVDIPYLLRGKG